MPQITTAANNWLHNSLVGVCVIVTRPAGTGDSLLRRIRSLDGRAIALPGLSLRAVENPKTAIAALNRSRRADGIIFVSPAAVRFAWQLRPNLRWPSKTRVFAVGTATARALMRHGVRSVCAPTQRQDSEGLLALKELHRVRGQRIHIVAGANGRDAIAATLRRRGAVIEQVEVYQRLLPRLTKRHFAALAGSTNPCYLLLSSAAALNNLERILPLEIWRRLQRSEAVVSSQRLAGLAKNKGFASIIQARSANAPDMLAAAARALGRHKL